MVQWSGLCAFAAKLRSRKPRSTAKKKKEKLEFFDLYSKIKIDLRAKNITRNKKGHLIMIKGSFHQVNITILNAFATNNRASKYMK